MPGQSVYLKFVIACLTVSAAGCGHAHKKFIKGVTSAKADLQPLGNSKVKGTAQFSGPDCGCNSQLRVEVSGLKPNQNHGVHVHEHGDCSAKDGSSAGAHYNPMNKPHGGPDKADHHVGDFGNIKADSNGKGTLVLTLPVGVGAYLGRAVVVHAGADDLTTQPSGASGDRVACGVIGVSK